ncbi:MAG: glycosyltransferase family 2 protein [Deltaproteobacteria bacterium]|nr:glycosyltransferase family 2 protein [Deltaproteobacteria bacterium]
MMICPDIAVCIVTHNSARDLASCLDALDAQQEVSFEIIVVDCASRDDSVAIARSRQAPDPRLPDSRVTDSKLGNSKLTVVALPDNLGFAGGMNEAIGRSEAPLILSLNADAWVEPGFLKALLNRMEGHPELQVGAVTGRLVRFQEEGKPTLLDACGMYWTRNWRHFDRGSGEEDRGQWPVAEKVFGGTGAATLFRRSALEDVAFENEIFDLSFHSFREDAELCFRLRERGWEVLYEPTARAVHRRFNLPDRRSQMPARVNYHSLKNRYLLRFYHQTAGNFASTLAPTLLRDTLALIYVALRERTSFAAYGWLWQQRHEIRRKRRWIQRRRTVPPAEVNRWFRMDGEPL